LLSNLVLDEFDRELQRRGHLFARYADDCNIYVRSRRAGERVMESLKRFLATKLKQCLRKKSRWAEAFYPQPPQQGAFHHAAHRTLAYKWLSDAQVQSPPTEDEDMITCGGQS
jgi:hypothetical protein